MQAFKRLRLAEVGLAPPANLHFVPVDLEQENLATALTRSAYDPHAPSFFGWLGVTMYLDRNAIFGTLRAIRSVATAGSSVVFDYFDRDAFVPAKAAKRVQATVENIRRLGEFIHTGIEPSALGTELSDIGFRLAEHLQPDEIEERYFQGRTDGYYACEHAHLAWAVVE
jgi:methyltransferase (TIGR00027 family)